MKKTKLILILLVCLAMCTGCENPIIASRQPVKQGYATWCSEDGEIVFKCLNGYEGVCWTDVRDKLMDSFIYDSIGGCQCLDYIPELCPGRIVDERRMERWYGIYLSKRNFIAKVKKTNYFSVGEKIHFHRVDNDEVEFIATSTVRALCTLLKYQREEIEEMFAINLQSKYGEEPYHAKALLDCFSEEEVSTEGIEVIQTSSHVEKKKFKKIQTIQSAFVIQTMENQYCIAIEECVRDDTDKDNVGVHSIYVFDKDKQDEAKKLLESDEWEKGVNILTDSL